MKIIGIVESDECSGAAIVDSDFISIIKMNDYYVAASRCMITHIPVTCEISEVDAKAFVKNGVICLDFNGKIEEPKTKRKRV